MELMTQVFFLVIGFVLLVKGADWFVEGAASIADKFGIPQIVIGLTIVAMGTSAPEAAVSISAAMHGIYCLEDRNSLPMLHVVHFEGIVLL